MILLNDIPLGDVSFEFLESVGPQIGDKDTYKSNSCATERAAMVGSTGMIYASATISKISRDLGEKGGTQQTVTRLVTTNYYCAEMVQKPEEESCDPSCCLSLTLNASEVQSDSRSRPNMAMQPYRITSSEIILTTEYRTDSMQCVSHAFETLPI